MSWTIGVGATMTAAAAARWYTVSRRQSARVRELQALSDEPVASASGHLSPALGQLARQAQVVRHALATPMHRWSVPLVRDTPWGRRARCTEYDLAIGDARRALWEWLLLFRRLGERDLQILQGLGLSPAPFYAALFRPGLFDRSDDLWEEVLYPEPPDLEHVFAELRRMLLELRSFEAALTGGARDPYRR